MLSSGVEGLKSRIAERLHPLSDYDPATRRPRSDYDLNPDHPRPDRMLQPAAVLIALVQRPEGLAVILTRRADTLARHSGQIAFPGGRCDPGEQPWETALREAEEEIGLERRFVRLAGLAEPYETVTGFHIVPVVGFVSPGFTIKPALEEVADVFETPFSFLMDPANHERRSHVGSDGLHRAYYVMSFEARDIWGATAGMLRSLYERLYGDERSGNPSTRDELIPQSPPLGAIDH